MSLDAPARGAGPAHPSYGVDRRPRGPLTPSSMGVVTVGAAAVVGVAAGLGAQAAAAAVAGVAVALLVVLRPVLAAYALVALVPPVSGLRAGLLVPQLRLSEALVGGIGVLLLLVARPGRTPRWRAVDRWALAYVAASAGLGGLALLMRGGPVGLADVEKLVGPVQFLVLYRAVLVTLTTDRQRRTALRLLLLSSVPVSVLAVLQELHVGPVVALLAGATGASDFGTTAGVSRATGPFAIWHDLGAYSFVVVLLCVALLVDRSWEVMRARGLVLVAVLASCALAATVTVTAILGTVVGAVAIVLRARPRRPWVLRAVVVVVLLAVAAAPLLSARFAQQYALAPAGRRTPFLPETIEFRLAVWKQLVPVLADHALVGYGPGVPPDVSFRFTESVYVTLLLRGGLPLLLVYAGLVTTLALAAHGLRRAPDPARAVVARLVLLLVVLGSFMQLVTNYFVNAGFPFLLWVLAALLLSGTPERARR